MTLKILKPTSGKFIMRNFSSAWAEGGDVVYTISVSGITYRVHEFRAIGTSTFNVLKGGTFQYLIVAGGGGGGGNGGGGGGVMAGFTPVRARNELGRFIADDPATPDVDEAWVAVPGTETNDSNNEVAV